MDSNLFYSRMAVFSISISGFSLVLLAFSLPSIYLRAQFQQTEISLQATKFKMNTDAIWNELVSVQSQLSNGAMFFSRNKKQSLFGTTFCKGCITLSCPMGLAGPPGNPGPDGEPGAPGMQGRSGDDGFDIQPEEESELPCSVCPAGPPGMRGPQGERGTPGPSGVRGEMGSDGNPGMDGPIGMPGLPGRMGLKGPTGPQGPEGEMVVAGVGIKGPRGPPGPAGMKGAPGPKGKSSNLPGMPGQQGDLGPKGMDGNMGLPGLEGSAGAPGDPGMPSTYCPSDCGVNPILANVMPSSIPAGMRHAPSTEESESSTSAPNDANEGSNPYAPPTGRLAYGERTRPANSFSNLEFPQAPSDSIEGFSPPKLHSLSKFERKMRKKLLKKMLKMQRMKKRKMM